MSQKDEPTPTAEGLIRTMYCMLKTDLMFGVKLKPSDKGWMTNAEVWIKSLPATHDNLVLPVVPRDQA